MDLRLEWHLKGCVFTCSRKSWIRKDSDFTHRMYLVLVLTFSAIHASLLHVFAEEVDAGEASALKNLIELPLMYAAKCIRIAHDVWLQ